jgi:glycosyltransferase involved in cell wall biosynthesis/SAM-dependent methyltransferase
MRVHVLGLPHTQTTDEFTTCAFTQKTLNLCKMLHDRGHEVIHYGVEGSNPQCTKHVSIIPLDLWKKFYGHPGKHFYNIQLDGKYAPYHALFAQNMKSALRENIGPRYTEIICQTWGAAQCTACEGIEQYLVESGIGYPNSWAEWRVYESYAWMHMHLGRDQLFGGQKWYWAVIPNSFDLKNFMPSPDDKRGEDFLYLGRLNVDKGVGFAVEIAKEVGRKITIVGQGDPEPYLRGNPHVTYLPPVGVEGRRKLLAEARAVFCLTQFVEPFCGVNVEAQLMGTPVITSDHGVFSETVIHGVTGFRGRTMEQWVWAAKNIDRIDGRVCAEWARTNYSLERVALMYEEFFQQILNVRDRGGPVRGPTGFYEKHPARTQLDWLLKKYPKAAAELSIDLTRPHEAPVVAPEASAEATRREQWRFAMTLQGQWWGLDWSPRWDVALRTQETYFRLMDIKGRTSFANARVLDVGCGPLSLLQRTQHGPSRGVDPLPMTEATKDRFREANVELLNIPAEEMPTDQTFDEIWMYDCLGCVQEPQEVLKRIVAVTEPGTVVRIFEWLNRMPDPQRPHKLTEALFWEYFGDKRWDRKIWNVGLVHRDMGSPADGPYIAIHVERRPDPAEKASE